MNGIFLIAAAGVLATVVLGLVRVVRGPAATDRLMAAQLLGTGGIAALLLFGVATETRAALDVALTLAILAPFAAVGIIRGAARAGAKAPRKGPEA